MQKKYSPMENPENFFDMKRCPFCSHNEIHIEKTEQPIRRYKCRKCGCYWKGVMVFLLYEYSLESAAEYYKLKKDLDKSLPFF